MCSLNIIVLRDYLVRKCCVRDYRVSAAMRDMLLPLVPYDAMHPKPGFASVRDAPSPLCWAAS